MATAANDDKPTKRKDKVRSSTRRPITTGGPEVTSG
jgi:hypothetical protein